MCSNLTFKKETKLILLLKHYLIKQICKEKYLFKKVIFSKKPIRRSTKKYIIFLSTLHNIMFFTNDCPLACVEYM